MNFECKQENPKSLWKNMTAVHPPISTFPKRKTKQTCPRSSLPYEIYFGSSDSYSSSCTDESSEKSTLTKSECHSSDKSHSNESISCTSPKLIEGIPSHVSDERLVSTSSQTDDRPPNLVKQNSLQNDYYLGEPHQISSGYPQPNYSSICRSRPLSDSKLLPPLICSGGILETPQFIHDSEANHEMTSLIDVTLRKKDGQSSSSKLHEITSGVCTSESEKKAQVVCHKSILLTTEELSEPDRKSLVECFFEHPIRQAMVVTVLESSRHQLAVSHMNPSEHVRSPVVHATFDAFDSKISDQIHISKDEDSDNLSSGSKFLVSEFREGISTPVPISSAEGEVEALMQHIGLEKGFDEKKEKLSLQGSKTIDASSEISLQDASLEIGFDGTNSLQNVRLKSKDVEKNMVQDESLKCDFTEENSKLFTRCFEINFKEYSSSDSLSEVEIDLIADKPIASEFNEIVLENFTKYDYNNKLTVGRNEIEPYKKRQSKLSRSSNRLVNMRGRRKQLVSSELCHSPSIKDEEATFGKTFEDECPLTSDNSIQEKESSVLEYNSKNDPPSIPEKMSKSFPPSFPKISQGNKRSPLLKKKLKDDSLLPLGTNKSSGRPLKSEETARDENIFDDSRKKNFAINLKIDKHPSAVNSVRQVQPSDTASVFHVKRSFLIPSNPHSKLQTKLTEDIDIKVHVANDSKEAEAPHQDIQNSICEEGIISPDAPSQSRVIRIFKRILKNQKQKLKKGSERKMDSDSSSDSDEKEEYVKNALTRSPALIPRGPTIGRDNTCLLRDDEVLRRIRKNTVIIADGRKFLLKRCIELLSSFLFLFRNS